MINDSKKEAVPDPKPLIITIWRVSFPERLLVQLFSKPQEIQASRTKIDPFENESDAVFSSERRMQDVVMMLIERASLFPIFS